jgi:hypothetical protein
MYSTQEGNDVLLHIDNAHEALVTEVTGLSDAQSRFTPSPEAWSVSGIVEHLAIVEDRIVSRLHELLTSPPEPDKPVATKEEDDALKRRILDRSSKAQAPEATHPTGKSITESLDSLLVSRNKIRDILRSAPADFRQRSMPHPRLGPMDCHQWLVTLGGHCARHTQQIIETKTAPGFPRLAHHDSATK